MIARRATCQVLFAVIGLLPVLARGQEEPVREPPPKLEDFETDSDKDGIPDGWYNVRDGKLAGNGVVGPTCYRFESSRPGRPARASRGFGIDGSKFEAVVIGLWVRAEGVLA